VFAGGWPGRSRPHGHPCGSAGVGEERGSGVESGDGADAVAGCAGGVAESVAGGEASLCVGAGAGEDDPAASADVGLDVDDDAGGGQRAAVDAAGEVERVAVVQRAPLGLQGDLAADDEPQGAEALDGGVGEVGFVGVEDLAANTGRDRPAEPASRVGPDRADGAQDGVRGVARSAGEDGALLDRDDRVGDRLAVGVKEPSDL
jgi:hypothetical protein